MNSFVDAPVWQFLEEVVDVFEEPGLQFQEGTLEMIQPVPAEFISSDELQNWKSAPQRKTQFVKEVAVMTQ